MEKWAAQLLCIQPQKEHIGFIPLLKAQVWERMAVHTFWRLYPIILETYKVLLHLASEKEKLSENPYAIPFL